MNRKVVITMECDTEIVGEILAAASLVGKKRAKDVVVTQVEERGQAAAK